MSVVAGVSRRLLTLLVSAAAASVVVFAFMQVLPGDPVRVALGINATEESVAALRASYGLDRPLPVQYVDWMRGLVTFDLGRSYLSGAEIGPQIAGRLGVSLWLVGAGILIALGIAVPLGTIAAVRHRNADGAAVSALSQVGIAIPAFLAGILLVAVFAVNLRWLPAGGWVPPERDVAAFLRHLALPALSLGLVQAAVLTRYVRTAVLEVWREDYIRTARAKGLTKPRLVVRHALRNAAIPVVTVLGLQLSTLLIGSVVIERVFVLPGLGSLLLDAVGQRDLLMVQDVVMVLVVLVLLINTIVDLLYGFIDPRIRVSS
ncbi:MAG: ABC transporter permease [Dermatophilus congolensis]|nr:ABC transporter permease [Dermatophilus congolensis]